MHPNRASNVLPSFFSCLVLQSSIPDKAYLLQCNPDHGSLLRAPCSHNKTSSSTERSFIDGGENYLIRTVLDCEIADMKAQAPHHAFTCYLKMLFVLSVLI